VSNNNDFFQCKLIQKIIWKKLIDQVLHARLKITNQILIKKKNQSKVNLIYSTTLITPHFFNINLPFALFQF